VLLVVQHFLLASAHKNSVPYYTWLNQNVIQNAKETKILKQAASTDPAVVSLGKILLVHTPMLISGGSRGEHFVNHISAGAGTILPSH
jgi:hypothetical protein